MKLYTMPAAPNPRKVHAVIEHLELKGIEIQIVNIAKGEQRSPDYLALNPMARVPTLVDGDLVLWESNAICQYLCDVHGDSTLYPVDKKVRADITRWMFWQTSDWTSATAPIAYERFVKKLFFQAEPDQARVDAAEKVFHEKAAILDKHLEKGPFLVGNDFTLADIAVGALLAFAAPAQLPLELYANVRAYQARLDEVPAWRKTAPQFGR